MWFLTFLDFNPSFLVNLIYSSASDCPVSVAVIKPEVWQFSSSYSMVLDPEKNEARPHFPNTLNLTAPQGVDHISAAAKHADDNYELYKNARDLEADPAEIKRVLRKIDLRIIPILFFTYMLQYLDKNSINFSSVYGLQKGTNLKGQDYSWLGTSAFCSTYCGVD